MKNNKTARHVLIMTATIDPNVFQSLYNSKGIITTNAQLRLAQYLSAIKFYIQESAFTDIIFVENSLYEFDYKKYEDMARTVGKTFEYLPMKLSDRQLGFMKIIPKHYGEALLVDYAMRNGKAVAESDEIYKVTGRVLLKNSDKIIRCARKGVSEAICINARGRLIQKFKSNTWPCLFLTVFFKISKIDYFSTFCDGVNYYEKYITVRDRKYLYIEQLWYSLAKENNLKIYGFKVYPIISGITGSTRMQYDKTKFGLFIRNILCKFGYYSLKS